MKKRVHIIATGGTVAGRPLRAGSATEYEPGALTAAEVLAATPGLAAAAETSWEQASSVGSEDMTETVWAALSAAVGRALADEAVDGVVVLHGTDTMEETAYLLHLLWGDTEKAVVMTGSMLPPGSASADGPGNILAAVQAAAQGVASGVVVALAGEVFTGRDAVKVDMLSPRAFAAPNAGLAGRIVDGRVQGWRGGRAPGAGAFRGGVTLPLPRVEIVYCHAGQHRALVDAAVAAGADGIVMAGVGMGNIHVDVRGALAEAAAMGVTVVCSSRIMRGLVPSRARDRRERFIPAGDLNPQKARVLLQLALARGLDDAGVREAFARC